MTFRRILKHITPVETAGTKLQMNKRVWMSVSAAAALIDVPEDTILSLAPGLDPWWQAKDELVAFRCARLVGTPSPIGERPDNYESPNTVCTCG